MNNIKCPKCGEVFQIDEAGYAAILQQVRDKEFQKQVDARAKLMEESVRSRVAAAESKVREEMTKELAQRKQHETELKSELDSVKNLTRTKLELQKSELERNFESARAAASAELQRLKDKYEGEIKHRDAEIAFYKDFKARLSTKMIGESLEQFCLAEFNKIRATAFQGVQFGKDNDARSGSKGDFIYRETDPESGAEILSIMFEMKNEADNTATKHRNEDFLKELDKDRREKKCEYAVLVSMLEPESDLYNAGIVDVSYHYEKMFVVRPQCFIPMITLLRNAAMGALQYKRELAVVRNRDIDITNFERRLDEFKDGFGRNCRIAGDKFKAAIEEIDKSIQHLQKIKEALTGSDRQLCLANDKLEDLTVKRLVRGNPTMAERFKAVKAAGADTPSESD